MKNTKVFPLSTIFDISYAEQTFAHKWFKFFFSFLFPFDASQISVNGFVSENVERADVNCTVAFCIQNKKETKKKNKKTIAVIEWNKKLVLPVLPVEFNLFALWNNWAVSFECTKSRNERIAWFIWLCDSRTFTEYSSNLFLDSICVARNEWCKICCIETVVKYLSKLFKHRPRKRKAHNFLLCSKKKKHFICALITISMARAYWYTNAKLFWIPVLFFVVFASQSFNHNDPDQKRKEFPQNTHRYH